MWCIPDLTPEYVTRMEELLDLYERPPDAREPVVCLDEKPVQLLKECREPIRADKPGTIMKRDSEYVRNGTANVFCVVEPKEGRHLTQATKNRKGPAFAKAVGRIAKAYPGARTIHLVMDNLSTHREKALRDYYGEEPGQKLWERFAVHYTPKHGSWLNQAEIECGLFGRQCLGKERVGDLEVLRQRTSAWNGRVNLDHVKIDWKFTTEKARDKFGYGRRRGSRRPAAFGLRLRCARLTGVQPARLARLGSRQNRPAQAAITSRSQH
jgi:hypothetical protein